MNPDIWNAISSEAKDLTMRLLDVDPNRRLTIEEALRHPWIAQKSRAPKTHLHETVEAMKHFNVRRRLKGGILAAVSSTKWASFYSDANGTHAGEFIEEDDEVTSAAVSTILESLEEMQCLTESGPEAAEWKELAFQDQQLCDLLELYDLINSNPLSPNVTIPDNATMKSHDVISELNTPVSEEYVRDVDELRYILTLPHFRALLRARDVIAHDVYGEAAVRVTPPPTTTFGSSTANAEEDVKDDAEGATDTGHHVTRVRLVQFQKTTDEPMEIRQAQQQNTQSSFANDVVNKKTCRGWFLRFKKDDLSLKNERQTESSMLKKLNSKQLQVAIDENPTCTTRELSETFH
ncbi:hypothetical protein ACTXT7_016286, partial [Hymenolepis weldensis]